MLLSVWPSSCTWWLLLPGAGPDRTTWVPTVSSKDPTSSVPSANRSVGCGVSIPCSRDVALGLLLGAGYNARRTARGEGSLRAVEGEHGGRRGPPPVAAGSLAAATNPHLTSRTLHKPTRPAAVVALLQIKREHTRVLLERKFSPDLSSLQTERLGAKPVAHCCTHRQPRSLVPCLC
jgi:hypothetical protein